jgi:hypothetical protein
MPLTDQQKQYIFQQSGVDSNAFDVDDYGNFTPKVTQVQPTATPSTYHPKVTPTPDSPTQTFGKSFASKALPAAAGGLGAGLGMAGVGALLTATGAGAPIGIPLTIAGIAGGGILGSMAGSAVQDAIMPDEWQQNIAESEATNPWAARLGGVATIPLSGFKPTGAAIGNIRSAGQGVAKLATGMRPTAHEANQLLNVGASTVLPPAIEAGSAAVQGQEINPADLLTSAAAGMLFNEPNRIGRRYGFTPSTPEIDQIVGRDQIYTLDEVNAARAAAEPQPQPTIEQLTPQQQLLLERRNSILRDVYGGTGEITANTRGIDPVTGASIAIPYSDKSNPHFVVDQSAEKLPKKLRKPEQRIIGEKSAAESAEVFQQDGVEVTPRASIEDSLYQEQVRKAQLDAAEAQILKNKNDAREASLRVEQQPRPRTSLEEQTTAELEQAGLSTSGKQKWFDLLSKFGSTKRGIKTEEVADLRNANGPVAGEAQLRTGLKEALVRLGKDTKGIDTPAHEQLGHIFYNDLKNSSRAGDRRMIQRYNEQIAKSEEFAATNAKRREQGLDEWDIEEYQANQGAAEFIRRQLNLAGDTPFKKFWKDFMSHAKTRYTKHGTEEDFRRLLNYRFETDPSFKVDGKANVTPVQTRNSDEPNLDKDRFYKADDYAQKYNTAIYDFVERLKVDVNEAALLKNNPEFWSKPENVNFAKEALEDNINRNIASVERKAASDPAKLHALQTIKQRLSNLPEDTRGKWESLESLHNELRSETEHKADWAYQHIDKRSSEESAFVPANNPAIQETLRLMKDSINDEDFIVDMRDNYLLNQIDPNARELRAAIRSIGHGDRASVNDALAAWDKYDKGFTDSKVDAVPKTVLPQDFHLPTEPAPVPEPVKPTVPEPAPQPAVEQKPKLAPQAIRPNVAKEPASAKQLAQRIDQIIEKIKSAGTSTVHRIGKQSRGEILDQFNLEEIPVIKDFIQHELKTTSPVSWASLKYGILGEILRKKGHALTLKQLHAIDYDEFVKIASAPKRERISATPAPVPDPKKPAIWTTDEYKKSPGAPIREVQKSTDYMPQEQLQKYYEAIEENTKARNAFKLANEQKLDEPAVRRVLDDYANKLATMAGEAQLFAMKRGLKYDNSGISKFYSESSPFYSEAQRFLNNPSELAHATDKQIASEQLLGRVRNIMPSEFELLREAGIEEAFRGRKVSAKEVGEWIEKNGPKVEVKELLATGREPSEATLKVFDLSHKLDTEFPDWSTAPEQNSEAYRNNKRFQELYEEYRKYDDIVAKELAVEPRDNDSATAKYTMVNPKPLADMPGAVDLLVRIPTKGYDESNPNRFGNIAKGVKFDAEQTHYKKEGDNLLSHVRGYFEEIFNDQYDKEVFSKWNRVKNDPKVLAALNKYNQKTKSTEGLDYGRGSGYSSKIGGGTSGLKAAETRAFNELQAVLKAIGSNLSASTTINVYNKTGRFEFAKPKKVFHVFEVQSDWAQQVRDDLKIWEENRERRVVGQGMDEDTFNSKYKKPTGDPLLPHYERLALKAAIAHAKKNGADAIAISDWQTAALSEGHDKIIKIAQDHNGLTDRFELNLKNKIGSTNIVKEMDAGELVGGGKFHIEKDGELFKLVIDKNPFEGGDTLHYDRTLPKIAEDLTGQRGEVVEFGEHQNAFTGDKMVDDEGNTDTNPLTRRQRSDLIFKNADGTPKTNITARMYDISGAGDEFTMTRRKYSDSSAFEQQINSPEFKKWFGDSKVVDENGRPLVVYHGSHTDDIKSFNKELIGSNSGDYGFNGYGFYFNKDFSNSVYGGSTYKVFLKIKNPTHSPSEFKPASARNKRIDSLTKEEAMEWTANMQKAGHDGAIVGNEIVVFEPTQIKSATGNSGKFNPEDPDIRNSVSSIFRNPFRSAVDKVAEMDHPDAPEVAKAFSQFYENQRQYIGKFTNKVVGELLQHVDMKNPRELFMQDNSKLQRVRQYLDEMSDKKRSSITLNTEEQQIAKSVRDFMLSTVNEKNTFSSLRKTKPDPNYFPHIPSRQVLNTWLNKPHSPEARALIADWYSYYKSLGMSKADADIKLHELKGGYKKQKTDLASQFGPIDDSAGVGLPPSWREKNLVDRMSRFGNRYSRRLAYHKAIELNPKALAALDDDATGLGASDDVRVVMEDIQGVRENEEAKRNAVGGLVRAGMLGPMTGSKDFTTNLTLGFQHQDPIQAVTAPLKAWKHMKQNIAESFQAGVNRHNIASLEFGDGGIEDGINFARRLRDVLNTVQGRNHLERWSRATAYGIGKSVAMDNLWRAHKGALGSINKKFLDDFAPNWRSYVSKGEFPPDVLMEVAARYVESVQGSYDYRGLPHFAQRGSLAPVLSLARWNIEKFNNFKKYNIEPLKSWNITPLLMSTVGMLIGGTAVNALVEEVTGRREKTATRKELMTAFKDGKNITDEVAYKLATLSSMAGYAGIVGDLIKSGADYANKNQPMMYDNPLIIGATTVTQNVLDAAEAMANGEFDISADFMSQMMEDLFQSYRLGLQRMSPDEQKDTDRMNKFRDLKTFKQLYDMPIGENIPVRPNPFKGKELREFKRTDDLDAAVEMLPGLIDEALANAEGNPERLRQELAKIKNNSYQTMPNPKTMPASFLSYLMYLERTKGKEAANERLTDYLLQSEKNRVKSSMVP